MKAHRILVLFASLLLLTACTGGADVQVVVPKDDATSGTPSPSPSPTSSPASADAPAIAKKLSKGVALHSMLNAPYEGAWGISLTESLFDVAKQGGFTTVRLPVRFSNHAMALTPYTIEEAFMKRVDFAIDAASTRGLNIVIVLDGYNQLLGQPLSENEYAVADSVLSDRFVAIWAQVAARYRVTPETRVVFELLNSPGGKMTSAQWNGLLQRAIGEIRKAAPNHYVIVTAMEGGNPYKLKELQLPADDRLIAGIQMYWPVEFAFQGASWVPNSDQWLGRTCCDAAVAQDMKDGLSEAVRWAAGSKAVYLTGFGSIDRAPLASRAAHAKLMRTEAELRGIGWAYHDLATVFKVWDPSSLQWRAELRTALTGL